MNFHLITRPSKNRILMAFRAGIRVKKRTETILRHEDALENFLSLLELCLLIPRKARERLAKCRLLG
jgi:hypothetical protein